MVPLRIASPILTLLSLLLLLAALSSNHWLMLKENQNLIHLGLWKYCVNLQCLIPLKVSGHMKAIRGFLILATLAGFLSLFMLIASFFRSHLGCVSLILVSAVGSISAGFCAMITMAIYTVANAKNMANASVLVAYGWSFAVGWAACPLFLLTSVVTLLSHHFSPS